MASNVALPHCRVCQTPYKFGGPEPYLLPCLHSVCKACLDSDIEGTMSCSICRETFFKTVRAKDAVTARAVFLATAGHSASELFCTNRGDGNQAFSWCQECEAFLCHDCETSHSENKSSKTHPTVSVEELVKIGKDYRRKQQCKEHKTYPLAMFDHDCDELLCLACRVQGHEGCDVGSIEGVYRFLKGQTLPEYISKLTEKMAANNAAEVALTEFDAELDRSRAWIKGSIRHIFQELHEGLQKREKEITQRLDQYLDILKRENSESLAEVRLMTERCDTVLDFNQKCLDLATPSDLFSMKRIIEARTTSCTRVKLPLVRSSDSLPMFTKNGLDDVKAMFAAYTCLSGDYLPTDGLEENFPDIETAQRYKREKQLLHWRTELQKVEGDMSELQMAYDRHLRHATELRRNLEVTPVRQFISSILNPFRTRRSQSIVS
ncbi:E3 ubiquitin-protein ligase TRIM33-like [Haliotis cracherodii]|uniref:E3 ubiquitin-protein ligase TRIM33-like n=1 Tax=Haliotis cracherodii TaxID=6455 RepID=UPI0039E8EFC8